MTVFVQTICRKFVRVDDVREFEYDGDDLMTIRLEGGIERKVDKENWRVAERGSGWQLCPAAPGTFMLHSCLDKLGEVCVAREPIVGWALSADGDAVPMTFFGTRRPIDFCAVILHPDGTVQHVGGIYDSYDHWLKDVHHELIMHAAESSAETAAIN